MATFYTPNKATTQQGSPEDIQNQSLQAKVGALTSSPSKRDIPGNLVGDFYNGKLSFEDLQAQIQGSPNFNPSIGPQINQGQGPQPIQNFQTNPGEGQGFSGTVGGQQINTQPPNRYKQGFNAVKDTKAPQTSGEGTTGVQSNLPPPPQAPTPPPSTPNVDNFYTANPSLQQSTQNLMDFLSPQSTKDDLFNQMKTITGEQNTLAQEKSQLMNYKRIMSGTVDAIRNEVTAANGFATESQVQALAIGRNKTLLKQAQLLQDEISTQQDLISNDTTLLNFEKDMANTQFTQRMGILQYQQTNQNNMRTAAKDTLNTLVGALGWDGILAAYQNDPQRLQNIGILSGLGADGIQRAATQAALTRAQAQLKETMSYELTQSQIAENQAQSIKAKNDALGLGDDNKILSVNDAQSLGVAYGTTVGQAKKLNKIPSNLTTSTRTMIEAAPNVKMFVNKISKEVKDAESGLGPLASRWRDLKANKIGFDDPAFSELTTNVGLLSTLLMRMHVGARGGVDIMEHFQKMLDTSKVSPTNLQSNLKAIGEYADAVIAEGKAGGQTSEQIPKEGDTKNYNGVNYKVVGGKWVSQ